MVVLEYEYNQVQAATLTEADLQLAEFSHFSELANVNLCTVLSENFEWMNG